MRSIVLGLFVLGFLAGCDSGGGKDPKASNPKGGSGELQPLPAPGGPGEIPKKTAGPTPGAQ